MESSGAVISDCGKYRYRLWRRWQDVRQACFIMLNPSTADASKDDPTIRKCIGFAKRWGCGGIVIVNMLAWRATDPRALLNDRAEGWNDMIGPLNDDHIAAAVEQTRGSNGPIVCAWGANASRFARREQAVRGALFDVCLSSLGTTQHGWPRHPLYVPYTQKLGQFDL